jgi:hypothetical protein
VTANGTTTNGTAKPRLRMPYGCHRGVYVNELPTKYLEWCFLNMTEETGTPPKLVEAIEDELLRRQSGGKPKGVASLADRWAKKMIRRYPGRKQTIAHGKELLIELLNEKEPEPEPPPKKRKKAPYGRFSDGEPAPF